MLIESFKKAWRGEEKFWKVFWRWGVLGNLLWVIFYKYFNITSINFDKYAKYLVGDKAEGIFEKILAYPIAFFSWWGFFIIPILSSAVIFKCSANSSRQNFTKTISAIVVVCLFLLIIICFIAIFFSAGLGCAGSASSVLC